MKAKARNCSKGYSCKATCISRNNACNNEVSSEMGKDSCQFLAQQSTESSAKTMAMDRAKKLEGEARKVEPTVTGSLKDISIELGAEMVGLKYRIKEADSMSRKIHDKAVDKADERGDDPTADDIERVKITDSLRYTMQFDDGDYTEGVRKAVENLESNGFSMVELENNWEPGDAYNGVNSLFKTPEGTIFELQFHTLGSMDAKMENHKAYEEFRLPETSLARRRELFDQMRDRSDDIQFPPNVLNIGIGVMKFRPFKG